EFAHHGGQRTPGAQHRVPGMGLLRCASAGASDSGLSAAVQTLRFISRIELPLLVTIYFSLMRRSQLRGLAIGMTLGLVQDSVFQQHIGMYGICKTLVGYFSASIGMQFDVEHSFVRLVLCFVFYLFHQFFYWVLQRSLLDQP